MALHKAVKTYPLVKWLLLVSALVVAVGLALSGILTPNDGESRTGLFVACLALAALLPFLALAFPRREVLTIELPTDHLATMSRTELEGLLQQLDAAKGKGEMDEARSMNARQRVLDALKAKGKAK